jgi:hypothetical protein
MSGNNVITSPLLPNRLVRLSVPINAQVKKRFPLTSHLALENCSLARTYVLRTAHSDMGDLRYANNNTPLGFVQEIACDVSSITKSKFEQAVESDEGPWTRSQICRACLLLRTM